MLILTCCIEGKAANAPDNAAGFPDDRESKDPVGNNGGPLGAPPMPPLLSRLCIPLLSLLGSMFSP